MHLLLESNNLNKEPQTQHHHTLTFPQEGPIWEESSKPEGSHLFGRQKRSKSSYTAWGQCAG